MTESVSRGSQLSLPAVGNWRMPAEWEPHESTWLVWPHAVDTWPSVGLEAAEAYFAEAIRLIGAAEYVDLVIQHPDVRGHVERVLRQSDVSLAPVRWHVIQTDDSWVRDTGPTWRVDDCGRRSAICWRFNAWGEKYHPHHADAAAGREIAIAAAGLDDHERDNIRILPEVFEGGAIDVDGYGRCVTTRQCLLNPNRGPGRTEATIETLLSQELGVTDALWLEGGIVGDDTDGHVDDCARFAEDGSLLIAVEPDRDDPNFDTLETNRQVAASWASSRGIRIRELPMPEPVYRNGIRLPASYANFLVCNGRTIVPTFGASEDEDAISRIAAAFPTREVLGIQSDDIVEGRGAIHCLTRQTPAMVRTKDETPCREARPL